MIKQAINLETVEKFIKEITGCTRLMNRMNDNNPRAAAKILSDRHGSHSGAVRHARAAVNSILEAAGLPPIASDWEGVVKAPKWYAGPIKTSAHNDNYIGGGVNF